MRMRTALCLLVLCACDGYPTLRQRFTAVPVGLTVSAEAQVVPTATGPVNLDLHLSATDEATVDAEATVFDPTGGVAWTHRWTQQRLRAASRTLLHGVFTPTAEAMGGPYRLALRVVFGGAVVFDDSQFAAFDVEVAGNAPAADADARGGEVVDAGAADAGAVDAGSDAGAVDAGVVDAGSTGVLPPKVLGLYFFMYNSPRLATIQAEAPQYNVLYFAFAVGTNHGGTVSVTVPSGGGEAAFRDDLAAWKASGRVALLSVGGGSNNGLLLQSASDVQQFFDSITQAIERYGFQGLDWDLETGGSTYTVGNVVSLSRQLKARYGSSFVISLVPRPYEFRAGGSELYRDIATQLGDDCDLVGFQWYDYPEAFDASAQLSIIHGDLQDALRAIPASKIVLGAEAPNAGNAWSPTSVYRDAFVQNPGLRGAFIWDSPNEQAQGWAFAKTMGPVVHGP